jgi:hypothetical protein
LGIHAGIFRMACAGETCLDIAVEVDGTGMDAAPASHHVMAQDDAPFVDHDLVQVTDGRRRPGFRPRLLTARTMRGGPPRMPR